MTSLSKFEGREVVDTKVKITKAGDGLSAALEVDPTELRHKQVVQVLLECDVSKVTFENASEGEGLVRVHTLTAGRATLITKDHELHKATVGALNEMTEKLARAGHAKGSMEGQGTLDAADSASDEAWEGSTRRERPTDDSGDDVVVPYDASSLDAELTP